MLNEGLLHKALVGTRNEMSLRKAFQELLDHDARSKNLSADHAPGWDAIGINQELEATQCEQTFPQIEIQDRR